MKSTNPNHWRRSLALLALWLLVVAGGVVLGVLSVLVIVGRLL